MVLCLSIFPTHSLSVCVCVCDWGGVGGGGNCNRTSFYVKSHFYLLFRGFFFDIYLQNPIQEISFLFPSLLTYLKHILKVHLNSYTYIYMRKTRGRDSIGSSSGNNMFSVMIKIDIPQCYIP